MSISNQFALFCICIGAAFLFGIAYDLLSFIETFFVPLKRGKTAVVFLFDILFFVGLAVWSVGVFYLFHFPSLRFYYLFGFLIGGIIYLKSLHRILAFVKKICYNKSIKIARKLKMREKT